MKRASLVFAVAVLFAATVWAAETTGNKSEEVTLTGNLSCAHCKLTAPDQKCGKECCETCIKGGDSTLFQDEKGSFYLLIGTEHCKPLMTPERLALLGEKVVVKGKLAKTNGVQGIYVEDVKKAEAKQPAEKK